MLLERIARWFVERKRTDLGSRGERAAARYLRANDYRVIEMNWRCSAGEVDIICRDAAGQTLIFVEVKSRESEEVSPEEQVNTFKERQVGRVADVYCRRFKGRHPLIRFDVVAVVMPPAGKTTIRHHIDAFVPPD